MDFSRGDDGTDDGSDAPLIPADDLQAPEDRRVAPSLSSTQVSVSVGAARRMYRGAAVPVRGQVQVSGRGQVGLGAGRLSVPGEPSQPRCCSAERCQPATAASRWKSASRAVLRWAAFSLWHASAGTKSAGAAARVAALAGRHCRSLTGRPRSLCQPLPASGSAGTGAPGWPGAAW